MRLLRPISSRTMLALALCGVAAACDNDEPSTPTAITPVQGQAASGRAGEPVNVSVRVTAANGRNLGGQIVTFAVTGGGGTVVPVVDTTDDAGLATTVWTLGRTLGVQTLSATVAGLTPLTVTATAAPGRPAAVTPSAGNAQTAPVGSTVATRPAVRVVDAGGNPVQGVQVLFSVTGGGGSITGAQATTDAQGIAAVGSWLLGTTAGVNRLQAFIAESNVQGNPVEFTAIGTAGAAARIELASTNAGTGTVGTALTGAALPSVIVRDASGNPVANVPVTFTVAAGGGTLTGSTQTTNAQGVATVSGFTLGTAAGVNVVTITAQGVPGTQSFTIVGQAGPAAAAAVQAGNNQSVRAGQPLQVGPSVVVRDRFGNPVAGVTVNFVVTAGGGSVLGSPQTTNAQGVATVGGFTLGAVPGTNTLVARIAGLPDVVFTATGLAGAPAQLTLVSGDSATTQAFQRATAPFVVQVRDSAGFPVRNVPVTFAIQAGGAGSLSATTVTTDSLGRASVFYQGTGTLGTATVTASVAGLPAVSFFAQTVSNTATRVIEVQGNNQTATAGTQVALTPIVQVRDAQGNPVPGVNVLFNLITPGSGVINPTAVTDSLGRASAGGWFLSGTPGENVLSAVVQAPNVENNPIRFVATGVALPTNLTINVFQGDAQTATRGQFVPVQPAVIVRSNGNPVAGVTVQFLPSGDGQTSAATAQTDANGVARVSWRLTSTAGPNTLQASVVGAGVSVQFSATAQ